MKIFRRWRKKAELALKNTRKGSAVLGRRGESHRRKSQQFDSQWRCPGYGTVGNPAGFQRRCSSQGARRAPGCFISRGGSVTGVSPQFVSAGVSRMPCSAFWVGDLPYLLFLAPGLHQALASASTRPGKIGHPFAKISSQACQKCIRAQIGCPASVTLLESAPPNLARLCGKKWLGALHARRPRRLTLAPPDCLRGGWLNAQTCTLGVCAFVVGLGSIWIQNSVVWCQNAIKITRCKYCSWQRVWVAVAPEI